MSFNILTQFFYNFSQIAVCKMGLKFIYSVYITNSAELLLELSTRGHSSVKSAFAQAVWFCYQ